MARKSGESVAQAAAVLAAVFVIALSSCAGVPRTRLSGESAVARLGPSARVYAFSDAPTELLPIIEAAFPKAGGDRKLADLLSRTGSAAVALFTDGENRFRLVASGDFPRFQTNLSLSFSRDWKRVGGPKPYWRSLSGLSLAFDSDGAVIVSDGVPWVDGIGPAIPAAFHQLSPDASLRSWVPEPSEAFARVLGPAGESIRLPMEELAFSLKYNDGAYQAEIVVVSGGEREARALSAILRFARNLFRDDESEPLRKIFSLALRADILIEGRVLRCTIDGLAAADLAVLLPVSDSALLYPEK